MRMRETIYVQVVIVLLFRLPFGAASRSPQDTQLVGSLEERLRASFQFSRA